MEKVSGDLRLDIKQFEGAKGGKLQRVLGGAPCKIWQKFLALILLINFTYSFNYNATKKNRLERFV